MVQIEIEKEDFNKRLDIFLTEYFKGKYNRKKISDAISANLFLINNKSQKSSYKLKVGDCIKFENEDILSFFNPSPELTPWDFRLDIKYEDDDLIVLNKPKDLLCHPTKHDNQHTLVNALLSHCSNLSDISGEFRKGIVHRLDKNTAGLMLVSKTNFAHQDLSAQIREKIAIRKYLALALGEFSQKEGKINKPLVHYIKDDVKMTIAEDGKGLEACTIYKVIESFRGASLVELELKTGRTHQIRAHLASINHPVFGDSLYGAGGFMRKEFNNLKTQHQLLQSYYLSFFHPRTKEKMTFVLPEEEFSKDFIKVLNFLRSKNNEY